MNCPNQTVASRFFYTTELRKVVRIMTINKQLKQMIDRFQESGFEIYWVGGCVRDWLLGRKPHDFDMTTNALPDEIQQMFLDYKTLDIGKKHGTITVFCGDIPIEITTYRVDGAYSDNRHPKEVRFTPSLEEDLKRRDFTVNAFALKAAYSNSFLFDGIVTNDIVDLFGGTKDLQDRIIRVIGNGKERFQEDALRILRAFRFMAKLNFTIESKTKTAIKKQLFLLNAISKERIFSELCQILSADTPQNALLEMYKLGIWKVVIPEIDNSPKLELLFQAIGYSENDLVVRLALLLSACKQSDIMDEDEIWPNCDNEKLLENKKKIVLDVLKRLHCDNKTIKEVLLLLEQPVLSADFKRATVKRYLCQLGENGFVQFLQMQTALFLAQGRNTDFLEEARAVMQSVIDQQECYRIKQLAVNGNDLKMIGIDGKTIGDTLEHLLAMVMEDEGLNTKETLLEFVKENL